MVKASLPVATATVSCLSTKKHARRGSIAFPTWGVIVCVTHFGASSLMLEASPVKFKATLIPNSSAVKSPAYSALTSSDFLHLHPIANPRMDSLKATGVLPVEWPVVFLPKLNYPKNTGFGPSARRFSK
jgi:hypothetical protein